MVQNAHYVIDFGIFCGAILESISGSFLECFGGRNRARTKIRNLPKKISRRDSPLRNLPFSRRDFLINNFLSHPWGVGSRTILGNLWNRFWTKTNPHNLFGFDIHFLQFFSFFFSDLTDFDLCIILVVGNLNCKLSKLLSYLLFLPSED